jgi:Tol biopolymer transport system component
VSYSPDGKLLAVTRVADKEKPPLDQAAPQLQVMTTEGKQERQLGSNMGPLFRWFPDSQRLLAFQIKTKDKEGGDYFGQLVVVDVASGKQTALAEVQTDQQMFFDLSPDGKEAMLTARIAANAGARLPKTEAFENSLYRVDVDKRTVTESTRDKATDFAIYSPDGKHVLIGEETDGFDFTGQQITIADPQLGTFTTVARDAHKSMSIGGEGIVYPVWYDDKTILYFVERANYGTEGKSLSLTMVGVDGENKKCVQPLIDLVAVQSP